MASAGTKKRVPKALQRSEHDEQVALFAWAQIESTKRPELALLFAVPNFARLSPRWGAYMKAEGKRAGVPDVCLPVPRGRFGALFIEMKVGTNTPSNIQEVWIEALHAAGNYVAVCYSFDNARGVITNYLALGAK
jgi:hypothetical protein